MRGLITILSMVGAACISQGIYWPLVILAGVPDKYPAAPFVWMGGILCGTFSTAGAWMCNDYFKSIDSSKEPSPEPTNEEDE